MNILYSYTAIDIDPMHVRTRTCAHTTRQKSPKCNQEKKGLNSRVAQLKSGYTLFCNRNDGADFSLFPGVTPQAVR
jgi:hypothetical protein